MAWIMMAVVLAGLMANTYGATDENPALTEYLQRLLDGVGYAYSAGDIGALVSYDTDELQVMAPGRKLIKTKEELVTMYQDLMKVYDRLRITNMSTKSLCADSSYAAQENRYILSSSKGDKPPQHGETVFLWKKIDGVFVVVWAIWSPDEVDALDVLASKE